MFEVRQSAIHGNGVFATERIPAGTHICDYRGELIDANEMLRRQNLRDGNATNYVMAIDDDHFIDATEIIENNPTRFINHSCNENCEAIWDAPTQIMKIIAQREIVPGEELSFDYGFDLLNFFQHRCHCGAKNCCGYIVAKPLRGALFRKLARHKRARGNGC